MLSLNTGDTGFVMLCTALVCMMTPALALFYGGMVRKKNVLTIMMQNFISMGVTAIIWIFGGFSLAFGPDVGGLFGDISYHFALDKVGIAPSPVYASTVPFILFFAYQLMFAVIAPALITGAFAGRLNFRGYLKFLILWMIFIYIPVCHWIWGGGFLAKIGVMDFAGGIVIHVSAGFAALASVIFLGRRDDMKPGEPTVPNNLPLVAVGAGLLWFGWFGFNGGQTLSLTGEQTILKAASIFFTTNIAAAAGTTTAMVTTWIRYGKPDVSMTLDGSLAALVAITAGCDVVSVPGAFVIGALAGIVTVFLIEFIDQKLRIDDPVGAIAAHGGCGALGTLLTGLFSVQDGLFYTGEIRLFLVQLAGVVAMALFVFVAMTLVFRILQATIGLRVSAAEEINGLDFKENGLVPAYELDRSDDLEDLSQALKAGEAPEGVQEIPLDQAIPDSVMASPQPVGGHALYNVTIITDEKRFETLKDAMEAIGITGMTITRALGFGIEKGRTEFYRGAKVSAKLLPKVRVEMVVSKVSPRTIIETAKKVLYTGNYGDGKVFVSAIDNAVKIRTGEEGCDALQDYPVVQKK